MSQHIITVPFKLPDGSITKIIVLMFGWDSRLSQLYAQYHTEKPQLDSEGNQHFEAIDDSLNEINLTTKPSYVAENKSKVLEQVRDNILTLVSDAGIDLSRNVIETIDIISNRIIEDSTNYKYRLRTKAYSI